MIRITKVSGNDPIDLAKYNQLLDQLQPHREPIDLKAFHRLCNWCGVQVWLAFDDYTMVGTMTLIQYPIPTGERLWIEDLVVDQGYRGKKIGQKFVEKAISVAKELNIAHLDLTSNPTRIEANQLYQKMGFERRITNVYRKSVHRQ
jgi:GNAT superfamily N-acetyltransferase